MTERIHGMLRRVTEPQWGPVQETPADARTELEVAPDTPRPPWPEAPPPPEEFGVALRRFRVENGLEQDGLGEVLGVNQTTISSWERGDHPPVAENLAKLLDVLPELRIAIDLGQVVAPASRGIPKPEGNHETHPTGARRAGGQLVCLGLARSAQPKTDDLVVEASPARPDPTREPETVALDLARALVEVGAARRAAATAQEALEAARVALARAQRELEDAQARAGGLQSELERVAFELGACA